MPSLRSVGQRLKVASSAYVDCRCPRQSLPPQIRALVRGLVPTRFTLTPHTHAAHRQSTPTSLHSPLPVFCDDLYCAVIDPSFLTQPLQALTVHLPATYRICNPGFKYESSRNPRRVLTKPSKGTKNDGYDNEDSDYILYVNDILGSEEAGHK